MLKGKMDYPIEHLKPNMETLVAVNSVRLTEGSIVMAKADGEFTLLKYENEEGFTVNRYGHYRKDFPALNEAVEALKSAGLRSAEILCELYAVDDEGKPLILPDLIRFIKGKEKKLGNVRLGVFNLVSVDDREITQDYKWKVRELETWFHGCRLVGVLPWTKPKNIAELQDFWKRIVEEEGWEGLVVDLQFKVKPTIDIDAVILALNKVGSTGQPCKRWREEAVSSVRVALMDNQRRFVVMGDCTIADRSVQKALWKLRDFKISEDDKRIYVKPVVVLQMRFTSMFKGSVCEIMEFNGDKYRGVGEVKFWKMRNPRFIRFRKDKEVKLPDIRLNQVEIP